jgi:hypothetical protein
MTVVALGGLALLSAACGSSGPPSASTTTKGTNAVSVPRGWKTYTYGGAAISAPPTWAVRLDFNCPDSQSGTVELGPPTAVSSCPAATLPTQIVSVSSPIPSLDYTSCRSSRVNGLTVYSADCTASDAGGGVYWIVPALGVEVTGTVSGAAGSGPGSPVYRVLHTLRPATLQELASDGALNLRITLTRTRTPAGTPIQGTAIFTNRTSAPVSVDTCAADGWLDVGLSSHTVPYAPAYSAIACTPSVWLAVGVTRTPFTVLTTYQGCSQSGPGSSRYPPCDPGDRLPSLPAGTYHTDVITSGLPATTRAPNVVTVTLTHEGSERG